MLSKKKDEDDRKEMAKAQVNAAVAAKGYDVSQFRFNNWGNKGSQTRIVSAPQSQMGQPAAEPVVLPSAPCSHGPPEGLYPPAAPPPSGAVGCSILGRRAEPPQFWVLLIWLEPGISHVTWVHYDATMCLACFVCSILPVLHFLRFDLCVL